MVSYSCRFCHGFTSFPKEHLIMEVIDWFSLCLISLPDLPSAFKTAELILTRVFRHHGIPEDIVNDQRPQFKSWVRGSFMEKLGGICQPHIWVPLPSQQLSQESKSCHETGPGSCHEQNTPRIPYVIQPCS